MDDPMVTSLGGAIGAYFDYVDENRAIARELGGIHLLVQNIKNNFHGQYSEWNYEPVKQSLFGLSSGTWTNADICVEDGLPELVVQLIKEHGTEDKIAEEALQATKAMIDASDVYRRHFSRLGGAASMVYELASNPHDRGAVDLACETMAKMIGPYTSDRTGAKQLDPEIQANATKAGAVEQILATTLGGAELHHSEHGGFNFDVDAAYNYDRDCFFALANLARGNQANQDKMLEAGIQKHVSATLYQSTAEDEWVRGCELLSILAARDPTTAVPAVCAIPQQAA